MMSEREGEREGVGKCNAYIIKIQKRQNIFEKEQKYMYNEYFD